MDRVRRTQLERNGDSGRYLQWREFTGNGRMTCGHYANHPHALPQCAPATTGGLGGGLPLCGQFELGTHCLIDRDEITCELSPLRLLGKARPTVCPSTTRTTWALPLGGNAAPLPAMRSFTRRRSSACNLWPGWYRCRMSRERRSAWLRLGKRCSAMRTGILEGMMNSI